MQFLMAFDAFPMRARTQREKKKLHATPGIHYNNISRMSDAAALASPSPRVNEVQRAVIEFNNVCVGVGSSILKCFSAKLRHDCSQYSWAGTHL